MGYARSRLKPVKKSFNPTVWVVGMLLLVTAVVVASFCLFRGRTATDLEEIEQPARAVDQLHPEVKHYVPNEKDTEVQKNVCVSQDEGSKPSGMTLDLDDYSNLQDTRFCRRHGLDETKVSTDYDVHRRANVHRYAPEEQDI